MAAVIQSNKNAEKQKSTGSDIGKDIIINKIFEKFFKGQKNSESNKETKQESDAEREDDQSRIYDFEQKKIKLLEKIAKCVCRPCCDGGGGGIIPLIGSLIKTLVKTAVVVGSIYAVSRVNLYIESVTLDTTVTTTVLLSEA